MFELTRIEEILKTCVKLQDDLNRIESPDFMGNIKESGQRYAGMFGGIAACASMAAKQAEHALALLADAQRDVAILERLQAVMEELGVYANIDTFTKQDNTRELKMLEVMVKDGELYRFDLREMKKALREGIDNAEEDMWDTEAENARNSLGAAGFSVVEDDWDNWHRSTGEGQTETVRIEMDSDRKPVAGYKFEYTRNGEIICAGRSGEFATLIAHIAPVGKEVQSA